MIEKSISELEAKIRASEIGDAPKRELLQSLAQLRMAISDREKQNLTPLKNSVEELRASVEGFEQSHPKLVEVVNRISSALANLGI